jgi:hypothetical protein
LLAAPRNFEEISVPSLPDNGMVHLSSPYSVAETIKRLESLLHGQGLSEFAASITVARRKKPA